MDQTTRNFFQNIPNDRADSDLRSTMMTWEQVSKLKEQAMILSLTKVVKSLSKQSLQDREILEMHFENFKMTEL